VLEQMYSPQLPVGLLNYSSGFEARADVKADYEADGADGSGPPLDRQSFLALSSLFPDVAFW
jgi:hypothetical protein